MSTAVAQTHRASVAEQEVMLNREKIGELERAEPEKDVEQVVAKWLDASTSLQQQYASAQASARKQQRAVNREPTPDVTSSEAESPRRVRFPELPAAIVGEGAPFVGDGDDDDDDDDDGYESGTSLPSPAAAPALSWQDQLALILVRGCPWKRGGAGPQRVPLPDRRGL